MRQRRLEQPPLLFRVFERGPLAFTIGGGSTAAIVLSESLLETMTGREIRGILAHEIIHLRNGDLALMRLAVVVGRLTRVLSQLAFMLVLLGFFCGSLPFAPFRSCRCWGPGGGTSRR